VNVFINGSSHLLNEDKPIGEGGEGKVFALTQDELAKIYLKSEQTDIRRKKVLALCYAYWKNAAIFGDDSFAFPKYPAYTDGTGFEHIVGYAMRYFRDCETLEDLSFDFSRQQFPTQRNGATAFSDRSAVDFVYRIFELVEMLHKGRIILGDINARNILYHPSKRAPVIVDLDSAQVGLHPCTAKSDLTRDPLMEARDRTVGGKFYFNTGSDVYGLACIVFRFLVGVWPFKILMSPPLKDPEAKAKGITSIRVLVEGSDYLTRLGHAYASVPVNERIVNRLNVLKPLDATLFDFFYQTLARENRDSLLYSLDIADARHPSRILYCDPGILKWLRERKSMQQAATTVAPSAQKWMPERAGTAVASPPKARPDPVEFAMFASSFKFDLATLVT